MTAVPAVDGGAGRGGRPNRTAPLGRLVAPGPIVAGNDAGIVGAALAVGETP
ncbi:MAG: hypothetical protein KJ698_13435 [Actinobacteria bacterium]|nr:hypothetical protein [Actinomycetota bacterium]MBU1494851.1 hypothetical protein [Actinomycetota bacterium]